MGDGLAAAVTGVVGTFVATLVCGAMVFGTGMVAEGGHRITVGVPVTRPAFGQSSIAAAPAWFSPCRVTSVAPWMNWADAAVPWADTHG